jgi:hypothetical protein
MLIVPGIDDAAQVRVLVSVGVEFVQDQSWVVFIADAVEHSGLDIVGAQDVRAEAGDEVEGGGFAATRFGGGNVEPGRVGKGFDCVGVTGPEGQNYEGAGREEEIVDGAIVDLVEKGRSISDRFGPGFEAAEDDGVRGGVSGLRVRLSGSVGGS